VDLPSENFAHSPAAIHFRPDWLDVFCATESGDMFHCAYDGERWWGRQLAGDPVVGSPTVVSWGPERVDVFAPSMTGSVLHWWWTSDGGWSHEDVVGPRPFDASGGLVATSSQVGRLDIFARSADMDLHWACFDALISAWTWYGEPIARVTRSRPCRCAQVEPTL
jgi:hypothetical protein